jgi:hypothetical protein
LRLFYDTYTTRVRSELLLFLADATAIAAVVLLACGALHRNEAPFDFALIALWAVIPRGVSKILGWLGRRSLGPTLFRNSVILVLAMAGLVVTGWELIYAAAPRDMRLAPETFSALLLAWGTTFLLFNASVYRFFDLFLFTTVFLALREGKPDAALWLPLFFLSYFFSCYLRHVLYDALAHRRISRKKVSAERFPLNPQNARVLALLGTVASCTFFFGTYQILHGGFDFPAYQSKNVDVHRASLDMDLQTVSPTGTEEGEVEVEALLSEDDELFRSATQRRIGFRYSVSLRDLTLARYDKREVLRVSASDSAWRPRAGMLWKAVTFSAYDAETEEWVEEVQYKEEKWPDDDRLALVSPMPVAKASNRSGQVRLDYRVIHPVCRNFVTPYYPLDVVATGIDTYRVDTSGDIFPKPGLVKDSMYSSLIHPIASGFVPKVRVADVPDHYLTVPPAKELGMDLTEFAGRIFTTGSPTAQKILTLKQYFHNNYRYSDHAHWQSGDHPVALFLLDKKVGDCTYHATAATLLLRSAGVPARLSVGFLSSLWAPKTSEAVVRNSGAHAWVEYYLDNAGWYPVDPTAWVPVDSLYRPQTSPFARRRRLVPIEDTGDMPWNDAEFVEPDQPSSTMAPSASSLNRWDSSQTLPVVDQEIDPLNAAQNEYAQPITWLSMTEIVVEDELVEAPKEAQRRDVPFDDMWSQIGQPGSSDETVQDDSLLAAEKRETFSLEKWRPALRVGLTTAGVIVLALLVLSFLKPARAEEEEEDDEDSEGTVADELAWEQLLPGSTDGLDPSKPRDRVLIEYVRLQEALERTRSHRLPHQTPLEHGHRISGSNRDLERTFLKLHRVLYRALYRGGRISPGDIVDVTESCETIRRRLG